MNLRKIFLNYCEKEEFEINKSQLIVIDELKEFYEENFKRSFLTKLFKKKKKKF